MSLITILLIVLIVLLIVSLPNWNHSRAWGYGPTTVIGIIIVVLLILLLTGHAGSLRLD